MTIDLFRDGNAIGAMIGRNLQEGVSGWGDTVPEALRDLALAIERERWQFPELEAPRGGPPIKSADVIPIDGMDGKERRRPQKP